MKEIKQTYYECGLCGSIFADRKACEACERSCSRKKEYIVYQLTLCLTAKGAFTAVLEEDYRALMGRKSRWLHPVTESTNDYYVFKFKKAVPSDRAESTEQVKLEMMQDARKWLTGWIDALDAEATLKTKTT